jgi:hypothetical protein
MEQPNEPREVRLTDEKSERDREAVRELARNLKAVGVPLTSADQIEDDIEDDYDDDGVTAGEIFVTSLVSHVCAVSRLKSLVNKFRLRPPERTDRQQQAISEQIASQIARVNTHRAVISAWTAVTAAATRAAAQQQEEAE